MRSQEKVARLRRFEGLCREQGLSMTVQRRTILEAVLDREDHPTADQVYGLVGDRIPGVSRTTVYRVLKTLVGVGVISKVCHPGAAIRFDPKIRQHHHLVCLQCDGITDIEDERLNGMALPSVRTKGFEVQEFHIHLRGVCAACRRKAGRRAGPAGGRKKDGAGRPASGTTRGRSRKGRSES